MNRRKKISFNERMIKQAAVIVRDAELKGRPVSEAEAKEIERLQKMMYPREKK